MIKIVVLDGYAANPGDISWEPMEKLGALTMYERTAPDMVAKRIGDAQAVFTNKVIINEEIMDACPKMKFIGVLATGFNVVDVAAARARGIDVCNIPAYSTPSVAQMTFSLLLDICFHAAHHSDTVHSGKCHTVQLIPAHGRLRRDAGMLQRWKDAQINGKETES